MRVAPGLILLLSVVACAPAQPGTSTVGPLASTVAGGATPAMADAGAMRACTRDAKDLTPCSEDCDRGIAFACALVAMRIERGDGVPKDLTRAVLLHERACELRDVASCVTAARMHASGSGVPPSRAKQVELLEKACAFGEGTACVVAAKAFENGTGVARNGQRADDLWLMACIAGVTSACEDTAAEP